jgi:hypothetical protein
MTDISDVRRENAKKSQKHAQASIQHGRSLEKIAKTLPGAIGESAVKSSQHIQELGQASFEAGNLAEAQATELSRSGFEQAAEAHSQAVSEHVKVTNQYLEVSKARLAESEARTEAIAQQIEPPPAQ